MHFIAFILFLFLSISTVSLSFTMLSSSRLILRSVRSLPSFLKVNNFQRMAKHSTSSNDDEYDEYSVVGRCTLSIKALLNPVEIKVTSSNDDPNGSHIKIVCISEEFTGKTMVQRQKLVYKAIWEELNGPVHAVDSIIAKTPKEAGIQ